MFEIAHVYIHAATAAVAITMHSKHGIRQNRSFAVASSFERISEPGQFTVSAFRVKTELFLEKSYFFLYHLQVPEVIFREFSK